MSADLFTSDELVSMSNVNTRITSLNTDISNLNGKFPVSVANGGTGQTSLTNGDILLGNGTNGINSVTTLPITSGGTGGTTATQARTNLEVMTGISLWGNSSGTTSTIALSDTYTNYDFIYIQFNDYDVANCTWFRPVTNSQVSLINLYRKSDNDGMWYHGAILTFSGKSVTFSRGGSLNLKDSSSNVWTGGASNGVKVTKIIGFKY